MEIQALASGKCFPIPGKISMHKGCEKENFKIRNSMVTGESRSPIFPTELRERGLDNTGVRESL